MARLEKVFQNRTALTVILFAAIAAMVAYKTVQTKPFQGGPEGYSSQSGLQLAQDLMRAKPLEPEESNKVQFVSGAGYPLAIAALAFFDPELKGALGCHERNIACDPSAFKNLFAVQYVVAVIGLLAIFLLAWVLSRSWSVAGLTLILSFAAGSYGGFAGQLSPLIWQQTLMLLFLLCVALAATRDDMSWTFAAGLVLGCCALFAPQLIIVGLITALSFGAVNARGHLSLRHPLGHALALSTGGLLIGALILYAPARVDLANALKTQFSYNLFDRLSVSTSGFQWSNYLIATPGIFLRGLWVGTPILTLLGLIHLPSLLKFSREDARLGPTLLVSIPILSLVVINTLVTANRPEYNVGVVFLLCYATAYLIGRTDIRRTFWANKRRAES